MATIFSPELVFIDVPETGGNATTHLLLERLRGPVAYVSRTPLEIDTTASLTHISGRPHQPLAEVRAILAQRSIDMAAVPHILAVVRNPYDLLAAHYASRREHVAGMTLLDASEAPAPPRPWVRQGHELRAALQALGPGQVIRIEPGHGEQVGDLRQVVHHAALQVGRPVESWATDEAVFVAPDPSPPRPPQGAAARKQGFPAFVHEMSTRGPGSVLDGLHGYYHLEGTMPPNLRLLRYEHLADDLDAALHAAGIDGDVKLDQADGTAPPAIGALYDEATEALVFSHTRWMFDLKLYDRLDPALFPPADVAS